MGYTPFGSLASGYNAFVNPVAEISLDGNVITVIMNALTGRKTSGFNADSISVTLNKNTASSAQLTLAGEYNLQNRSFRKMFNPGTKISISLGYGSKLNKVFVGYVDTVSYEFSQTPKVTVTAFDAVKLMTDAGAVERTWDDGSLYTDTITKILDNYKDICPLLPTNMKPSLQKHGMLQQTVNDFEYLKKVICKYCDRDFIVNGGYSHIVDADEQFGKLTDLGLGNGLISMSVNASYASFQGKVSGSVLTQAYGESSVINGGSYKVKMNHPQILTCEAPLKTNDECKQLAKRLAQDAVRETQTSSGVCVGIPDIIPGVGIGISGLDSEWDGKTYFVDTAVHTFGAGGYTTSFKTKGWK